MSATADLQIVLRAVDSASPALRSAAAAAQNLGTGARNAAPGFAAMTAAVAAGTVAANAFMTAARGLVSVFSQAGGAAADFDQSIASMRSKLSTAEWDQYGAALQQTALRLGKDYPLSAGEAGKAIDLLVQKGVSAKAINEGWAESVVQLSSATGSDLVTAAGIAAAASDAFGISASQSGEVVSRITGAVIRGGMSIEDFGHGFQAAGAVVALAGGSIDDVTLGLAAMARRGIEGSDAGTSLKTMYMNLIPTTKAAKQTMAELGIVTADGTNRFFDATGKAKSYEEISKILAESTKGLTQAQKLMALETIFGSDAIRAAAIAAELGSGEISELADAIKKVDAGDVAKKRMDSLKGSLTQFTGSAETLGIVLVGKLAPGFRTLIDTGTNLLNRVLEKLDTPEAIAFFEELAQASQDFGSDLYAAGQSVSEFGASIADVPIIGAPLNAFMQTLGSVLTGFAALMRGDAAGAADAFATALGALGDALSPLAGIIQPVIAKAQEIAAAIGEAFDKAGEMGAWDAFKNGLQTAADNITTLKTQIDRLGDALNDLDNAVGNGKTGVNLLAAAIRVTATAFELWVLGMSQAYDTAVTFFTSITQGASIFANLGRAAVAFASGDMDEYHRAMTAAVTTTEDLKATQTEFAERTLARLGEAFSSVADLATDGYAAVAGAATDGMAETEAATDEGMAAVTDAVMDGMAGAAASAADGMAGVVGAVDAGMAGAVGAADSGMAGVVASTDAGMAGMVASADAGAAGAVDAIAGAADPAAAAGAALGEAATSGLTAGAAGMADSAGSAAADAVGAVDGYSGAAYGSGSGLGSNLGAGLFDGIMAWIGQVRAAAASLVNAAIGAGNVEAEVESPSKRTRRTGEEMAKGYIEGLASLAPEMQERVRDFVGASADYVPIANEIKRVEQEIKDIRERAQTDAIFRVEEMIAVESEMLRLKRDQAVAERALVPLRQDLARATREIADIERGTLGDRTQLIELDAQRKAIRLQEIELEKQLIGLDRDSKAARAIQERLDGLRDQDRLLNLEADRIRTTNDLAAVGTRVRREGLDDQVRAQERAILAIKEQLEVLDAEADVFQANERIIKNATDNEIDYRERLIAVFRAEGKPLADRIQAGLRLVDQLEAEGKISKETATQLKKLGEEALKGKAPVGELGRAADTAGREAAGASRDVGALALAEAEAGRQAGLAKGQTDTLKVSLVGLNGTTATVGVNAAAVNTASSQVDALKSNLQTVGGVTVPVNYTQIELARIQAGNLDAELDRVEQDTTTPPVSPSQIQTATNETTLLDSRLDMIEQDVTAPPVNVAQIQTATAETGLLDSRLDQIEQDVTTPVVSPQQIQTATTETDLLDSRLDQVEQDTTVPSVNPQQIQTATNETNLLDQTLDNLDAVHTLVLDSQIPQAVTVATLNATDADLNGINNVSVAGNIETEGGNIETEGGDVEATTGDIETLQGDVTGPSIDFPDVNQMIVDSLVERAAGGPVGRGLPYLVGEQGPELFVPDAGGTILPASETAALMSPAFAPYSLGGAVMTAAGGGAGGVTVQIVVQGNTILGEDRRVAQELARIIKPELDRRVAASGYYTGGG